MAARMAVNMAYSAFAGFLAHNDHATATRLPTDPAIVSMDVGERSMPLASNQPAPIPSK